MGSHLKSSIEIYGSVVFQQLFHALGILSAEVNRPKVISKSGSITYFLIAVWWHQIVVDKIGIAV